MKFFSKDYFKQLWKILLASFTGFSKDNGLKLSASLAYYTVFSIAPLLIIVMSVAGLVFKQDAVTNKLYPEIVKYVGPQPAAQIQDALKHLALSGKSGMAVIIGVGTLLLGASSIFIEIQDSLNIIWRVKARPKSGWLQLLRNRFVSFSLIISLGFLLLASLIINIIIQAIQDQVQRFLPGIDSVTKILVQGLNLGITLIIITTLFSIIFKFLPDVRIKWRDVRSGSIFTAILFMLGQYVISLYIHYTAQGSAYGAAGSIIVILVWIYYTSAILYIGAEFTQVYAEASGSHIEPASYAVHILQTEVEHKVSVLPAQNPQLQGNLKKVEQKQKAEEAKKEEEKKG